MFRRFKVWLLDLNPFEVIEMEIFFENIVGNFKYILQKILLIEPGLAISTGTSLEKVLYILVQKFRVKLMVKFLCFN